MTRHIPGGYAPDHNTPSQFVVRCSDCGRVCIRDDRGDAHDRADSHALHCAQTGVTPISFIGDEEQADDEAETATLQPRITNLVGEEVTLVYHSKDPRSDEVERDAVVEEMLTSYLDVPYRGFLARAENGIELEVDLSAGIVFSHGNVRSPTGEILRVEPACEEPALGEDATDDARVATDGGEP
ncbi:hypothetical protein KY092_11305 [Natronomonas gomsonensis]|uniref:hypothetical protein n=1 Tax=Natronomonas gomsonensis TaxID=1046043 RepID=UPI0020CA60CF|nr:hypothetical protein [Natronomonas gomsonensis]MCY4731141.1 hypothetical protein [Natronomonas gomsonensis]